MPTKIISTTYANGYTLAASFTGLSITSTGAIESAPGTAGYINGAAGAAGGSAGVALTLNVSGAQVSNGGVIQGGGGGYGAGVSGGNGGTGVAVGASAAITNSGMIAGGAGGYGGNYDYYGGPSGNGGDGLVASAGVMITNNGTITGGNGASYSGNTFNHYGPAGLGGGGLLLQAGGGVTNLGTIKGGQPGGTYANTQYINNYLTQAPGVVLSKGGQIVNGGGNNSTALIEGGIGVQLAESGVVVNYGTIEGTGGVAVQFGSASDELVVYGGSTFIGGVSGDGGSLKFASGSGQISGSVGPNSAVVETVGATQTTFSNFGTLTVGAASQLAVAGTLINSGVVVQTGILGVTGGTIINVNDATWNIANGLAPLGGVGTFKNEGLLTKSAGPTLIHVGVDFTNVGVLTVGTVDIASGALDFTGASNAFFGTVSGAGTLVLGGGSDILGAPGPNAIQLSVAGLEVQGASTGVTVDQANLDYLGVWDQAAGSVSVSTGDQLTLSGVGDTLSGTLTGSGTVDFGGGSDTLKTLTLSAAHMEIRGSAVTLEGAIDLTGVMTVTTPSLIVAAGGATLDSGGTLVLTDAATNTVQGASATARLTNDGKIQGAGQLGGGEMRLLNEAGGLIEGDYAVALVIDTGAQIIDNAGLIKSAGTGGVTVDSAMDNAGTLTAAKGTLTLDGAVTGAGKVLIEGGTADFGGAFTEAVTFTAAGGELELAKSQSYTGTITGFSKTSKTSLDLEDIAFGAGTKATYSGTATSGTLTVTDGTHTARIKLSGNYTTSKFIVSSDGAGGTKVVDPTTAAAPHAFIAAMAGFGAAASPLTVAPDPWRKPSDTLASPRA